MVKKLWEKDRWNSFSASKMGYNMEQIATMRISKSGRIAPNITAGNSRFSGGIIRWNWYPSAACKQAWAILN